MKIRPVGAELLYAVGRDEANISSHPAKPNKIALKMGVFRFSTTSEH